MSRIEKKWNLLRAKSQKALIPFITAGDPDLETTKSLIQALEKSGADIIELGVPFSDPMADGPVIQRASERALVHGTSLRQIIELVRETRQRSQIPILLMGYYNPILTYGLQEYAKDAAAAGVDATLVVDLPPEESQELDVELQKVGVDLISLLTPTSNADRIKRVTERARGFIYFVSMTGVTGASLKSEPEIGRKIQEIKKYTSLPLVIGFGISTPDQAARMSVLAEGVVVGSALVSLIEKNQMPQNLLSEVEDFTRKLKSAISGV